jgi:hypothetical protein
MLSNINFNGSDHVVVVWFASAKAARFDIFRREKRSMSGTPERVLAARDAWLASKDAWLAAMAAHEAHRLEAHRLEANRLEANRLWLEYLELADPVRARKIRGILKHGEQGAAKTADELFPAPVSLGRSIPGPQELRHAASRNHPQIASTPLRGGVE